jgi:hypothetical protein
LLTVGRQRESLDIKYSIQLDEQRANKPLISFFVGFCVKPFERKPTYEFKDDIVDVTAER